MTLISAHSAFLMTLAAPQQMGNLAQLRIGLLKIILNIHPWLPLPGSENVYETSLFILPDFGHTVKAGTGSKLSYICSQWERNQFLI